MWSVQVYVGIVMCTLLSTTVYITSAQDDICVYQPGEYNTQIVEENGCVILDCKNITVNSTEYMFDGWILPSVEYINSSFDNHKVVVDEDEWTITVRNVTREDTGLYHCMLMLEGEYYLVRMGINIKGPFFISGWEEYQDNTIIGLVAFASFLVITGFIYLVYHFRFQSDDEDDKDYGKMAIDAYGREDSAATVVISRQSSVASVPNYIPAQEIPDNVKASFNDTSELRKRSPITEKKLEAEGMITTASPNLVEKGGVDNPAFESDTISGVISDDIVDEFFNGIGDDDEKRSDNETGYYETIKSVETTEL